MLRKIALIAGVDGVLKAAGFLLLPIYVAWMPKAEFGEFGFLYSAIGVLLPIVSFGLYIPQIKEFSSTTNLAYRTSIFSTTFLTITVLVISVLAIVLVSGIWGGIAEVFFEVHRNVKFKGIALSALLLAGAINLSLYAQAVSLQSAKVIGGFNALRFVLGNAVALTAMYIGLGYADTSLDRLVGMALGEIILSCIGFVSLSRGYWKFGIYLPYLAKALRIGLPIVPASIASLIMAMSDRYFVNAFYGASYLAEYNLAIQILAPVQLVMTASQTAWAPHVFSIADDGDAFSTTIGFFLKVGAVLAVAVPLLALVTLVAKHIGIIPLSYRDVEWLVPALALPVVGTALLQLPFNLFIRGGRSVWVAYVSGLGAVLTVSLGAVIVPAYGYFGAAAAGTIISVALLIGAWYLAKRLQATTSPV